MTRYVVEKRSNHGKWIPTNTWADEKEFIEKVVKVANSHYPDVKYRVGCWVRKEDHD